jgi:hypothetical protein
MKIFLLILVMAVSYIAALSGETFNMDTARKLYYQAVKDEDKLEQAMVQFEQIKSSSPQLNGITTIYIGSLTMIKGKHAFWPHKKVEYVNDGLKIMDKGIATEPNNLESLFIYGSSCYYLPFFLGKKDLAIEKLKKMIPLLDDENISKYDNEIMTNALKFIAEKIELNTDEKAKVNQYIAKLESKKK